MFAASTAGSVIFDAPSVPFHKCLISFTQDRGFRQASQLRKDPRYMEPPRSLGANIRVSHVSPKEGEIWSTLWSAAGVERLKMVLRRWLSTPMKRWLACHDGRDRSLTPA